MMHFDMFEEQKRFYKELYEKYGYSPKSLAWFTDKRNIRYRELVRFCALENSTILDVGCGFGDFYKFAADIDSKIKSYQGMDIVKEFIEEGTKLYSAENVEFKLGNFIENDFNERFDYVICSGVFNPRFLPERDNNYPEIFEAINKLWNICDKGISFNFVTDRVDFKKESMAYHNPMLLLEKCYELSNRVILNNYYMPYEATITILKDEIDRDKMLYRQYINQNSALIESGFFHIDKK